MHDVDEEHGTSSDNSQSTVWNTQHLLDHCKYMEVQQTQENSQTCIEGNMRKYFNLYTYVTDFFSLGLLVQ